MGPVLLSMIPGRPSPVRELKPWVRWTITLWVVIVVPWLLYWVVGFLIVVPRVLPVVWHKLVELIQAVGAAAAAGQVVEVALGVIQVVLLLLPWMGSLLLVCMMIRGPLRWALARCGPAQFRV